MEGVRLRSQTEKEGLEASEKRESNARGGGPVTAGQLQSRREHEHTTLGDEPRNREW